MSQYCPQCGAGPNDDGTFRLPKGYPFDPPCEVCAQRLRDVGFRLGQQAAEHVERQVFNAMFETTFRSDKP